MSIRDELRSKALKSKPRRRKTFTYSGSDYQIIEPTVGEYMKIKNKSKGDSQDQSIWTMITLTVIPDTEEKIFEETDYKDFLGQTFDGIMFAAQDALVEIFNEMSNTGKE